MLRRSIPIALLTTLLLASDSQASDHQQRISEVQLSAGGTTDRRYVELRDSSSEPFPEADYFVRVYEGNGDSVGQTQVPGPAMAARGTQPFLVATAAHDSAQPTAATRGDATLTTALPPSGQVCFEQGSLPTPRRIHCLAYGSVSNPISSDGGRATGPVPPDGQSLQRQDGNCYLLAAPTPRAANGTASCGAGGGGAGGGGAGGGGGGGTVDLVTPKPLLGGAKRQDVDTLKVRVRLLEAGIVTVKASVNVPGASRNLRFRTVKRTLPASTTRKIRIRMSRRRKDAVKAALVLGVKLKAKVVVTTKDAAKNTATARRRIRLMN